jgi:hypothetical protein
LAYNERVDRLNAIRLLQALVAAGANCDAPMADAWITKIALEIGLQNGKLYSALAYAGTQDWLADNQKALPPFLNCENLVLRARHDKAPNVSSVGQAV